MMIQKIVIALIIVFLAILTASILKFAEKKQLDVSSVIYSFFSPFFLVILMIRFFVYVYDNDLRPLPISKRFLCAFKFMVIEIQFIPIMHTTLINTICSVKEETNSKIEITQLGRSAPTQTVIKGLHGIIFATSKMI